MLRRMLRGYLKILCTSLDQVVYDEHVAACHLAFFDGHNLGISLSHLCTNDQLLAVMMMMTWSSKIPTNPTNTQNKLKLILWSITIKAL